MQLKSSIRISRNWDAKPEICKALLAWWEVFTGFFRILPSGSCLRASGPRHVVKGRMALRLPHPRNSPGTSEKRRTISHAHPFTHFHHSSKVKASVLRTLCLQIISKMTLHSLDECDDWLFLKSRKEKKPLI